MTSERCSVAPWAWGFRAISAVAIISTSLGLGWPRASAASGGAAAKLLSAPLSFEPNQGQTSSEAEFLSRGSGYALILSHGNVVLNLERQQPSPAAQAPVTQGKPADTLRMRLIGASAGASAVGQGRQTGVVSYFIGNDPKKWRTGIPTYGEVDYPQVYPGIDLVFYGNQRQLEYDFVVASGADPGRIAWRIDGARASVDAKGDLTLSTPNGLATFRKPVVYQMLGDKKANVEGAFLVAGRQVSFRLGSYDRSKPLVIDPVLSYVTYLAGSGNDYIGQYTAPLVNSTSQGLAIDAAGSVYVTGRTTSANFPTKNPYQGAQAKGSNASVFVTKFSPDGSSLVYSTYLAGSGYDYADAIAVDSSGSAYVTGNTNSNDFPVTSGAYQALCSPSPSTPPGTVTKASCNTGNSSAFVTKLTPAGTGLVYSTFLGGYGGSEGTAIAVDSAGRAYIGGNENAPCNLSYSFPACFPTTAGATIATSAAQNGQWAFAAVFDPTGATLLYSTLFGDLNGLKGSSTATFGYVSATGTAVDSNGYFYLIGDTKAGKLPTTQGAFQSSSAPLDSTGSNVTAFRGYIAKFNPLTSASAGSLAACTYLGGKTGNTSDYLNSIAIDSSGDIYVVGYTNSTDFPVTSGAFSTICGPGGGTCDAGHVTKLNPSLTSAIWSTYVGGSRQDGGDDLYFTGPIQLDGADNVYITGVAGTQFPLFNPVESARIGGAPGQMVIELDPTGSNLLFSTDIGSGRLDSVTAGGLAVNSAGAIYVAGNNIGADLITTPGAFETTNPSPIPTCCYHGFVAKITPTVEPALLSGTLANGATYIAGGLVPGSWAQVKGANLSTTTRIWAASDFTGLGNNLPTNLSGVQVMVNNQAAAVYYISPTQVSFQVPAGITGTASVQVIANGQTSNSVTAAAATSSPGIFPVILGGTNYAAAVFNSDGKIAADPSNGPAFRNAVPGDAVQLYATGLAASPAGTLVSTTFLSGVTVTIGTITVQASAAALVAVGEFQINFTVPQNFASLPAGLYPISISINGIPSPANINSSPPGPVVIPIQH
jgi:uncharacterized protein (TIGR03437 family)